MGKLKTKKGVAKRFRKTKKGEIVYYACGKSHLSSSKEAKRLRRLRRASTLNDNKKKKYLKRMLPYA